MKTALTLTIFAFTGCHLEQPFEGPGYSLGDGLTTEAAGPFVVSATNLLLLDGDAVKKAFDGHMAVLQEQIKTQPGLIGVSLGLPIGTEGYQTLTVWENEEAVLGWVTSEAHAAAMDDMADKAKPASAVASWTMTRAELEAAPPSWQDARTHLESNGRTVY